MLRTSCRAHFFLYKRRLGNRILFYDFRKGRPEVPIVVSEIRERRSELSGVVPDFRKGQPESPIVVPEIRERHSGLSGALPDFRKGRPESPIVVPEIRERRSELSDVLPDFWKGVSKKSNVPSKERNGGNTKCEAPL